MIEYLAFDFFEQIKDRIFCEIVPNGKYQYNRWEEEPDFFDLAEATELVEILDNFFNMPENRIRNLQNFILEINSLNIEEHLTEIPFKNESRYGIINFLSKNLSTLDFKSKLILSSSSTQFGWVEDILDWYSIRTPNSWICFHFISMKISLSGYRINSNSQINRPTGWMVEGSIDGLMWELIDVRNNYELNVLNVNEVFLFKI